MVEFNATDRLHGIPDIRVADATLADE